MAAYSAEEESREVGQILTAARRGHSANGRRPDDESVGIADSPSRGHQVLADSQE